MKIIAWLKSLSWIAISGGIFAAVMMVLQARSAGKMEAEVAEGEKQIKRLNAGTKEEIKVAAALQAKITTKKEQARRVRKKAEKHQERIGQDETMADIANRFNSKSGRVRSREDTAAEL